MEKVLLTDLPERKDLIGKVINVRRQGGTIWQLAGHILQARALSRA